MHTLDPSIDTQAPHIDFITEERIEKGENVVDTLRYFDPDVLTHLNGRKYVKESTVRELAKALGMELRRVPKNRTDRSD